MKVSLKIGAAQQRVHSEIALRASVDSSRWEFGSDRRGVLRGTLNQFLTIFFFVRELNFLPGFN